MSSPVTLRTVVAPVFGTNCYLVSAEDGTCAIVDAGAGVATRVREVVADHDLRPVAVLATHGHVDHTWDAAALCGLYDVPFLLNELDEYRIADPFGTLGLGGPGGPTHDPSGPLAQALSALGIDPLGYRAPARVETFRTRPDIALALDLPGLVMSALHAPGHTQGSTFFLLEVAAGPAVLTGDVLFAGTIGRTDLPGGDGRRMSTTLRGVVPLLDPSARLFPGHGPSSDLEIELRTNPYLAG